MDIKAQDLTPSNSGYLRIQAYKLERDVIELNVLDVSGVIIGKGTGRTLGRALFSAGLSMTGRDMLDFMDAVNTR